MKKILIVEDDVVLLKGLETSLQAENYQVLTETDGEKGYTLAKKSNPDLLVLDVNLPSKDGFEICSTLKKEGSSFPIFMLTNLTEAKNKLQGLSLGADDYIPKPFDMQELLFRIRNALAHSDQIKSKEIEYENELLKAQKIQLDSLPSGKPEVKGLDVDGKTISSKFVGGDYFDYIKFTDGRFGILIADVSGKGTSAALTVNKMQGILQVIKNKINSAEEILLSFQEYLSPILDNSSFVTAVSAIFDMKNRSVQIARAGHLPVLVKRNNEIKMIEPRGLFIGKNADKFFRSNLKQEELNLIEGDTFLFYTDGITEIRNSDGEEFGIEKLIKLFGERELNATELVENILKEIEQFSMYNIQKDDMTLVAVNIT